LAYVFSQSFLLVPVDVIETLLLLFLR